MASRDEGFRVKVLAVFPDGQLPSPKATGGVPVMSWALVRTLLDAKHEVLICSIRPASPMQDYDEAKRKLDRSGVGVYELPAPVEDEEGGRLRRYCRVLRRTIRPRLSDFYPAWGLRAEFNSLVERVRPDVLYLYTMRAVALAAAVGPRPPKAAALVDLDHLVRRYRREFRPVQGLRKRVVRFLGILGERAMPGITVRLLKDCVVVFEHAAHHAEWLKARGVANVLYYPNPVIDQAPSGLGETGGEDAGLSGRPPVFLLLGGLQGIATLSGLRFLADEVLPRLVERLGPGGFSVRIAGKGTLPDDLATRFARPEVAFLGFVENMGRELAGCHAFVVPTPIPLGFRTRIAEAFSYGACVVAHSANGLGMPELKHEENCLLADRGDAFAEQMVRACRDADLRRKLCANARKTYETALNWTAICRCVTGDLERAATSR